ncbi:MAG TPA: NUDIX domain-containing protein [Dinghuibacter sp.]|uniref:NUDIX hydrolase n=1 Tax=Dinghuibacter sp. TaxID=2024697 RepID=UPI002BCD2F2B|nr:NUDIX domain-containing protein [Dinghuibacter sp.]HTJ10540.1 NUDIX domain-containing protein [Dinghuibacter sp.]
MNETDHRPDLADLVHDGARQYLRHLSVDSVIFSFHEDKLKVLLLRMKDLPLYALPGGYVHKEESLEDAAHRILAERTGLGEVFLEQCGAFGDRDRTGNDRAEGLYSALGEDLPPGNWLRERFVSIAYYALVNFNLARPQPGFFDTECVWCPIGELPDLVFDHREIVRKARETLRMHLDHKLVGSNLLPETFTMNELQRLYEAILGRPLLRANFQRKMLGLEILDRLDKKFGGGAHKAPYLYKFKPTA